MIKSEHHDYRNTANPFITVGPPLWDVVFLRDMFLYQLQIVNLSDFEILIVCRELLPCKRVFLYSIHRQSIKY